MASGLDQRNINIENATKFSIFRVNSQFID